MIFVIGYGNPLRGDDAIGQHIAQSLKGNFPSNVVRVQSAYQLTPELAEPISYARFVIFIDARVGEMPGRILQEHVMPQKSVGALTHHASPAALLTMARNLYGDAPDGLLISITGIFFDYGSEMSAELNHRLPEIVSEIKTILESAVKKYSDEGY
jgi:hydrogenase maturation protease